MLTWYFSTAKKHGNIELDYNILECNQLKLRPTVELKA